MSNFAGKWNSTFGPMDLVQEGERVSGVYVWMGTRCSLEGTVSGNRLTFAYQEPGVQGEGWFELSRTGDTFCGQWRPDGAASWSEWLGERIGFAGLWQSDFG